MMQRAQVPSSTFIAAQDLQQPAQAPLSRPGLERNPSSHRTLLDFGNEPVPGTNAQARPQLGRAGITQSRSVFGVDPIWEKEMEKLKEIQAIEKAEEEERERIEQERKAKEDEKAARKAAKRAKRKGESVDGLAGEENLPRVSIEPPLLPDVRPFPVPPKPQYSESESDSDNENARNVKSSAKRKPQQGWNSDDEEFGRKKPTVRQVNAHQESDEDLPLAATLQRVQHRREEDSEEDQPLSTVMKHKSLAFISFDSSPLVPPSEPKSAIRSKRLVESDDDDNKPLALKHPKANFRHRPSGGDSDDEQPLGLRYSMAPSLSHYPSPQQQAQAQMLQQHVMQQQMMAAAQMRNSMFNPMMMGGMPPMGMQPMMAMSTGFGMPMADMGAIDPSKYGAVDRWRRDVGGPDESAELK